MKAKNLRIFIILVGCFELFKGLGGVFYFLFSDLIDRSYLLFCVILAVCVSKIVIATGLLLRRIKLYDALVLTTYYIFRDISLYRILVLTACESLRHIGNHGILVITTQHRS